jgi:acyl dehydratase
MGLRAGDVTVGEQREAVLIDRLTRTQIVQYAGASGDFNPLHTDEVFVTRAAGYPAVFAHGMLTMGIGGRLLTDWVGDGRLTRFAARFVRQVWPGDTLRGLATVEAVHSDGHGRYIDLSLVIRNQHDEEVMVGTSTARMEA